ncbi:MAG: hypothetical protein Q9191_000276 [Dirinaria sp. TL-2023a]
MFASKITRRKHQRDCHYVCKHPRCGAYLYTEETFVSHIQVCHADVYCKLCETFVESSRCLEPHMEAKHAYCRKCKTTFGDDEARQEHYVNANHAPPKADDCPPKSDEANSNKRKHQNAKLGSDEEEEEGEENMSGPPPDHYRTLGIDPSIPHNQLLMLVKRKRCETHPDRFMKRNLSPAQMENVIATAKNVGWAADILSDQIKRRQHDLVLQSWQLRRDERRKRKKDR